MTDNARIWNVRSEGSWIEGPRIKAKVVSPSGDWARIMPGGQGRLDVRLTLQTQDNGLISMSYNGIAWMDKLTSERVKKGETMKAGDFYFVIAPTFETKSVEYLWLNGIQAIGKMVAYKRGKGGYVKYDVFAVK